jgi:hypothetical protein
MRRRDLVEHFAVTAARQSQSQGTVMRRRSWVGHVH